MISTKQISDLRIAKDTPITIIRNNRSYLLWLFSHTEDGYLYGYNENGQQNKINLNNISYIHIGHVLHCKVLKHKHLRDTLAKQLNDDPTKFRYEIITCNGEQAVIIRTNFGISFCSLIEKIRHIQRKIKMNSTDVRR
jgi:hypothetical protein